MESWDICFRNLSVGYNGVPVLSDINATLPGGKVSVILGGSGCGKSTLLRHVIGLAKPIKGGILIGGKDLFTLSRNDFRRLRKRMGVLFQDGALLGALTLAQNVVLPLSEHLRLQKKLLREAALRVLRMVGLEEFADYYPNQLSGGMRKRAGRLSQTLRSCFVMSLHLDLTQLQQPAWITCFFPCMPNIQE